MRNKFGMIFASLTVVGMLQVGGCSPLTFPISFDLVGANLGTFGVQAGEPETVSGALTFDNTTGIEVGSGDLEISPESISITPTPTGSGKFAPTAQEVNNCLDACNLAGVDAAVCSDVCENNQLRVTVWIGTSDAIAAGCENGDEYVFDVTLDDNGQATSVSVTPAQMTQATIDLFNSGAFGICVEVISPIDGTIVIDTLTANVGL